MVAIVRIPSAGLCLLLVGACAATISPAAPEPSPPPAAGDSTGDGRSRARSQTPVSPPALPDYPSPSPRPQPQLGPLPVGLAAHQEPVPAAPSDGGDRLGDRGNNRGSPGFGPDRSCRGSSQGEPHCVLVVTASADLAHRQALAARLQAEGYEASVEGDGLVLMMTPHEVRRLFGAQVVYRAVAASSHPGLVCNAYMRGGRVPARYRSHITSFSMGHQICE